jgi:hypothetical protein
VVEKKIEGERMRKMKRRKHLAGMRKDGTGRDEKGKTVVANEAEKEVQAFEHLK